ncbi:MAG: ribosomal protein S18-alanine N-acetyltransferase [Actinomycetota bacterium]|nr:ribosomal protein S18-alanine N-acetyltransferase [Actinomycetota bacterium]
MTAFEIRAMTRRDVPAIVALEREVFDEPWPPRVFFDELAAEKREYIVIMTGETTVVGYGGLLIGDDDAHITTLAVAPGMRGRQIGKRLMLALVERALGVGARRLTLEVRLSNASAQGLYELFGFAPVGRRKDYYKDEDALVMWVTDIDARGYAQRLATIRETVDGGQE